MSAWWGRLLELAEIVLILSCRLVLRCVEEIYNKNQTVSAVNYSGFFFFLYLYEASLIMYQG